MTWKIYNSGNYVYIENTVTGKTVDAGNEEIVFKRTNSAGDAFIVVIKGEEKIEAAIPIYDMVDASNVPYTKETFRVFKETFTAAKLSSGLRPYKITSLATTNASIVKATSGNLHSIIAIGLSSTVRYLKIYNKATVPIVGTDIPVMTLPIPANTQGAGISLPFSIGVNFSKGIGLAITAGSADTDSSAIAAGDVIVNLTFN
jgi:hypothetical protein